MTGCSRGLPASRATLAMAVLLGAAAMFSGCGREEAAPASPPAVPSPAAAAYAPAEGEFSVMTYNTLRYALEDRDHDNQQDDPKPLEERRALVEIIASVSPDVLALQEMGGRPTFNEFKEELRAAGLVYDFEELLQRDAEGSRQVNLAVLSRLPIVSHQSHTNDVYTIGNERNIPVARGFIDMDIGATPAYRFRLFVAHLKSKVFHKLGQTEMRRNEARLLNKHVREALSENPRMNILVVGDLNDLPPSRAVREVIGHHKHYLIDLRPRDLVGDAWTHFRKHYDEYSRIDYALVSEGMLPEVVREKCRVVRDPRTFLASDHRPVVVVFKAQDLPRTPAAAADPAE